MTVLYHPAFAKDIRRFAHDYATVSRTLAGRFRVDVDRALAAVIENPTAAGHLIPADPGAPHLRAVRRRNLTTFPFFILYALVDQKLIFASLIPSASDPVRWMQRLHDDGSGP